MSSIKGRLEKVEREIEAMRPHKGPTPDAVLRMRLEDVRSRRYFPVGSIMSSLNSVENRKCFVVALENMERSYREQVEEALGRFALNHPAKWLLQYVIYVGVQHYHSGGVLRIPSQVCEWTLKFDPIGYGYEADWLNVYADDFCYDCGICYHTLDRPLVKQSGVFRERPFANKQCFDCSGPIIEGFTSKNVSSPARSNYGWRERQDQVNAIGLPEALQYETWDWEKIITEAFEDSTKEK